MLLHRHATAVLSALLVGGASAGFVATLGFCRGGPVWTKRAQDPKWQDPKYIGKEWSVAGGFAALAGVLGSATIMRRPCPRVRRDCSPKDRIGGAYRTLEECEMECDRVKSCGAFDLE